MSFWAKLDDIEQKFNDIEAQLGSPEIYQDQQKYSELAKKHSDLYQIVGKYREYKRVCADLDANTELATDPDREIQELARLEIKGLEQLKADLEDDLKALLIPEDPLDKKSVILEIRAGTGGEEAALFAADLLRMYSRYAENNGWKVELLHTNQTGSGGFKEVIASISGGRVYSRLKYESGVHRVQRVPSTESQGRVHTSAVTVAILPEADEVDVRIDPHDLRIDVFRSSGPGGQSVNTTDSAVRITHEPTGLVITCQDEKSQLKNKAKAMKVLRSRLLQMKQDEAKQEMDQTRRAQVGSGDRSERIRTYNFPQSRITDHRINLTSHNLEEIMAGGLEEIIVPLDRSFQTRFMQEQ
ncbi:MAG: peptide chain release factor 1 [Desulfohalobiaceae bacterium]|nr:peptide chain release factor 1 [Desulfohalobiaceae bacterium]